MLATEERIIRDYKKAIKTYYSKKEVIDIDSSVRINLDCWASRMEKMISEAGSIIPPQRQSRFIIFFVISGNGEQKTGNMRIALKSNTLFVVPSQVVYSSSQSETTKGYFLLFNINFFLQTQFPKHHLFKMDLLSSHLTLFAYVDIKEATSIKEVFETILDEQQHHRKKREELIVLKVLELIIICERILRTKPDGITGGLKSAPAIRFLDLIQKNYKEHHTTKFYAQKLHVHPNSLNAIAKRFCGQSAKSTIDLTIVAEAKHLLYHTGLSVKEISFELGFTSTTHFFRFFKKHTGLAPLSYRKSGFEKVDN
jgi:AraC family transcriptional regulator, transcriptional activator of pobA